MYNQKIIELFQNLNNAGTLRGLNGNGKAKSETCGDLLKIYLKIENDIILDAKYKAFGGVITNVVANLTCEKIKGQPVQNALQYDIMDSITILGDLEADKLQCIDVVKPALASAIADYYKRLQKEQSKN